jgi:exopolyphosphatase/guanosine-5'-triphosphate,3'-diphosphate pyrophosphatase
VSDGRNNRDDTDPRNIEIETRRVLGRKQSHYGVIDIGSNSIRLVVYDDLSRAPFPRFNEKSMVALGAGIGADGRFSDKVISSALNAVMRMDAIAKSMQVERVDVLATEATRRAENGSDLIEAIRKRTGLEPRILTGEEEANFTAFGVISGFFQPKGMVGDIGGGSLEVAEVLVDRVGERMTSMPLGAFPVAEKMKDGYGAAKDWIDGILEESLPPMLTEPVFYAVGGGWRALARIHIAMNKMPISVVHGYELSADELRSFAKDIAKMSADEIAELPDVPGRRIETLAASALVMSRVLRKLAPERVVFSAYGLREGWLYCQLDAKEQYRDPLLEGAQAIGLPTARVPAFSEALGRWTDYLFPSETQSDRRLRLSVCALTDIAWREHAKVRAADSFLRLLTFPFIGLSHSERAFVSVAIFARYGGKLDDMVKETTDKLLSASDLRRANILGRALLLAHRFSACVPEILQHSRLKIEVDAVRLEILDTQDLPDSDAVQTRLRQLAKAIGVDDAVAVNVEK